MIRFSTDSTCDLPKHFIEEYNFSVLPLIVTLGDKEYLDGVDITPEMIYDHEKKTGELPHTAGRGVDVFKDYFSNLLKTCDYVVHCGIGDKLSVCYQNAVQAVKELGAEDKVKIIDSRALSSSTGLILISGANCALGGGSIDDVVKNMTEAAQHMQCSFMVDRLDYLYKGGRVSKFSFSVASLLKIKPRLEMEDGLLINTGKEIGPFKSTIFKYIDSILKKYPSPRRDLCLIAHTTLEDGLLEKVISYIKSKNIFDKIEAEYAGSVITSHCGKGTLGILYINDGKN